ncbi:MAG: hypothetical protein AAGI15_05005 [Pseudomonadota bacterium]
MQIANAFGPVYTTQGPTVPAPVNLGASAPQPGAPALPTGAATSTGTVFPQQSFPQQNFGGFSSPFTVFGSPFAAAGYGNLSYGATSAATPGAGGAHTVVNSTNAVATSAAPEASAFGALDGAAGAFGAPQAFGSFGYAQPAFLVPAILPVGLPVFVAVGVFAFAAPGGAVPGGTPAPQPPAGEAPVAQVPVADAPVADAPATDVPEAPTAAPPPPTTPAIIDVPPVTANADDSADAPDAPVVTLSNPDFGRYAERYEKQSLTSELVLSLQTAEGDEISLSFKQLDVFESDSFNGRALSGERVEREDESTFNERFVTVEVDGELSAEEQSAIDRVLAGVTEVANAFFAGEYSDARSQLQALDFDASTLSELSLNLTSTREAEIARSYRGTGEQVDQLRNRGGEIVQALEFLASEQRQLIEQAKEVFDDPSAAKLVRTLVPSLLDDAVAQLREEVLAAAPPAADSADAPESGDVADAAAAALEAPFRGVA